MNYENTLSPHPFVSPIIRNKEAKIPKSDTWQRIHQREARRQIFFSLRGAQIPPVITDPRRAGG
jgi:hypothetical protein